MEQGLILDADLGSRNRKRVVLDMSDLSMFCVFPLQQGTIGFEQHIDKCLDLSHYLYTKIRDREGYQMVFEGEVRLIALRFLLCSVSKDSNIFQWSIRDIGNI